MEFKRAHNRAMRESKGPTAVNEDETENQTKTKYDGKSEYDIFRNVYEEGKIGH